MITGYHDQLHRQAFARPAPVVSRSWSAGTIARMYLQTRNRTKISLDGTWGFMPDPMGVFGTGKRSRAVFEGRTPVQEDRAVEYDIEAMREIQVPGDWNTQDPEWMNLEEAGWYTLRYAFSDEQWATVKDQRNILCFDSVNYRIKVWVNGVEVGDAECPFLPLSFDITEALTQTSLICVRIDAKREAHRLPSKVYDWWNYGGIFNSVYICPCPQRSGADGLPLHGGFTRRRRGARRDFGDGRWPGRRRVSGRGVAAGTGPELHGVGAERPGDGDVSPAQGVRGGTLVVRIARAVRVPGRVVCGRDGRRPSGSEGGLSGRSNAAARRSI